MDGLHINISEVSQEELIKTFEILHDKGLINQNELCRAVALATERYKSVKSIIKII